MDNDTRLQVAAVIAAGMASSAIERGWTSYNLADAALEIADALIERTEQGAPET